jgi:hypothetical protein
VTLVVSLPIWISLQKYLRHLELLAIARRSLGDFRAVAAPHPTRPHRTDRCLRPARTDAAAVVAAAIESGTTGIAPLAVVKIEKLHVRIDEPMPPLWGRVARPPA